MDEFEIEQLFVSIRALSDLDAVALNLIVERGPLNAETFGSLLLVAVTFCKRLENSVSLDIIETLHAGSSGSCGTTLHLLQRCWQLNFGGQLLYPDQSLPRQDHRIFNCIL